ncbi:MAG: DNA replication/repair protein RecF [Bacteroidales bacterium]
MYLKKLTLTNFKNYSQTELTFSFHVNAFVGNNGMGKTNLLDAIYYLSFCKSYFNTLDNQNIQYDQDFFAIHGSYSLNQGDETISCIQKRGQKKIMRFNKKEYERLSDHIGLLPLIIISPYDQDLIYDGSELRRKFLDSVISQYDKIYLEQLIAYLRTLEQRNKLLKQDHLDETLLQVFDQQLSRLAAPIYEKRTAFMQDFLPLFKTYYAQISGTSEEVDIVYQSHLDQAIPFETLLQSALDKDRILQYTSIGIHKDDLQMLIAHRALKKFGSQGQQKSFVLAMRLAQVSMIAQLKGFYPILLLDDIFDKLDKERVRHLMALVGQDHFGQVFLTDTDLQRVQRIFEEYTIEHQIYQIENGQTKRIHP